MASNAPTIIDLKTSFLRAQILALQKPLRPSPDFETSISASENALRQKAIDDALQKLNARLRRHNKTAYGPLAQRHVAEQLDKLYWTAAQSQVIGEVEDWAVRGGADYRESCCEFPRNRGFDLGDEADAGYLGKEEIISQLPEEWSPEAEAKAPEEAARYKELQSRLVELNEKRKAARERVEQYRAAKKLLEPFEGEDAGLQENLVTKNGQVEQELERMRMLMLRVERGIMGLEDRGGDEMELDVDVDLDEDENRKLLALLDAR